MDRSVLTVIDHIDGVYYEGLKQVLNGTRYKFVPGGLRSEEKWRQIVSKPSRDLLFLVGSELCEANQSEELGKLRLRQPQCRIAVLASLVNPEHVRSALAAGADGYLDMAIPAEVLRKSLDLIMFGLKLVPSDILNQLFVTAHEPARVIQFPDEETESGIEVGTICLPDANENWPYHDVLSWREAAVLTSIVHGAPNKGIARELNIAEATVKVHVKAILRKLKLKNRTQAAIWAMANGVRAGPVKSGSWSRPETLDPTNTRKNVATGSLFGLVPFAGMADAP